MINFEKFIDSNSELVSYTDIKNGDIIQRWVRNHDKNEWELFTTATAVTRNVDLAGRWTDENGRLVHAAHGGCVDAPATGNGFEILVRIGRNLELC